MNFLNSFFSFILLFFVNFVFSQEEFFEFKVEDFNLNGNVKSLLIENSLNKNKIKLNFNKKGYLIEKTIIENNDIYTIENKYEETNLIETKSYENGNLERTQKFVYVRGNLINYSSFSIKDTLSKNYEYELDEIIKISYSLKSKEYIENINYFDNTKITTKSLNGKLFEKIVEVKIDSETTVSKFDDNFNTPTEIEKYFYNSNNDVVKQEIYLYGDLVSTKEYFYNKKNLYKTISTDNDDKMHIVEYDIFKNWIKIIKPNNDIERRIIKYDKRNNIKKITEIKNDLIVNTFKYKICYW